MAQSLYDLEPIWRSAPHEHSPQHYPVFRRIAAALQTSLRAHVSESWDPIAHAADPQVNLSVLAWLTADPARETSVADFTYDVLNTTLMRSYYHSARHNLLPVLARLGAELRARGASDLVRLYRPTRIGTIIQMLQARRAMTTRLIGSEMRLMDALLLFAGDMAERRRSAAAAFPRLMHRWQFLLRRTLPPHDFSAFAPELFAIATRELQAALADVTVEESLRAAGRNQSGVSARRRYSRGAKPVPSGARSARPRSAAPASACTPENC